MQQTTQITKFIFTVFVYSFVFPLTTVAQSAASITIDSKQELTSPSTALKQTIETLIQQGFSAQEIEDALRQQINEFGDNETYTTNQVIIATIAAAGIIALGISGWCHYQSTLQEAAKKEAEQAQRLAFEQDMIAFAARDHERAAQIARIIDLQTEARDLAAVQREADAELLANNFNMLNTRLDAAAYTRNEHFRSHARDYIHFFDKIDAINQRLDTISPRTDRGTVD